MIRGRTRPAMSRRRRLRNFHVNNPNPDVSSMTDAGALPVFLTVKEAAQLLRTTEKGIYARIARRELPGVKRLQRTVLIRTSELLDSLDRNSTPSLRSRR